MPHRAANCHVLVVEDDVLSRHALTLLLRRLGFDTVGVRTVAEAKALLDGPTHVITDLLLPDDCGLELLRVIQARSERPRVAVVTALERDETTVRAAAALEPDILLRKPIDVDALLSWLDHPNP